MKTTEPRTCVVVRGGAGHESKQGGQHLAGISTESAGSTGICLHLGTIPPGARANAHLHEDHETAIYVLSGEAVMWHGEGLRDKLTVRAGEFLYIPANTPHLPQNPSPTEPCVAIFARTDPNEQESVVLLPDLDAALASRG